MRRRRAAGLPAVAGRGGAGSGGGRRDGGGHGNLRRSTGAADAGRLSVEGSRSDSVTPVIPDETGDAVPSWAEPQVGPVLVDQFRLAARVAELGAQITEDYADDPPLLVAVLKGAMLFMSDLCRAIALPVDVDFMAVSSYGSATRTSGVVRIVKDLDSELEGRHVLVVEDIIDSGLTLNYFRHYLHARSPKSVEVCALAGQGRGAAGRIGPALCRIPHPGRRSWWVTGSMWRSVTVICQGSTSTSDPTMRRRENEPMRRIRWR